MSSSSSSFLAEISQLQQRGQPSEARSLLLACLTIFHYDPLFLTQALAISQQQEDTKLSLKIITMLIQLGHRSAHLLETAWTIVHSIARAPRGAGSSASASASASLADLSQFARNELLDLCLEWIQKKSSDFVEKSKALLDLQKIFPGSSPKIQVELIRLVLGSKGTELSPHTQSLLEKMSGQRLDFRFLEDHIDEVVAWIDLNCEEFVRQEKWGGLNAFIKTTLLSMKAIDDDLKDSDLEDQQSKDDLLVSLDKHLKDHPFHRVFVRPILQSLLLKALSSYIAHSKDGDKIAFLCNLEIPEKHPQKKRRLSRGDGLLKDGSSLKELLASTEKLIKFIDTHFSSSASGGITTFIPPWNSSRYPLSSFHMMHADVMYSSHDYAECLQAVNRSLQESDLTALHKQKLQMQGIVCLLGEKKATEAVLSLTSFLSLHITDFPTGELAPCPSLLLRRLEVMYLNGADIVLLGFVLLLNFYESGNSGGSNDMLLKLYQYSWTTFCEDAQALLLTGITKPIHWEAFPTDILSLELIEELAYVLRRNPAAVVLFPGTGAQIEMLEKFLKSSEPFPRLQPAKVFSDFFEKEKRRLSHS